MRAAFRRLIALVRRNQLDDDLAEEIAHHLELRKQALIDGGMDARDAALEARRQFGNVTLIREHTRRQWGGAAIDTLAQDLRYGLRLIHKAPGFSAVAVLSLAVGIGASTVLFSLANAFLFKPLHAADPDALVQIFTSDGDSGLNGGSSYAEYEAFRAAPAFDGMLASARVRATLSGPERSVAIDGLLVSGDYFDVLGLRPSRGRFFRPEELRTRGTHPVVVLSDDAWRRRFNADPALVGGEIELNGRTLTVIGIGPPRFVGTSIESVAEFFLPVVMDELVAPGADLLRNRRQRAFTVFGRLNKDVALAVAAEELNGVAASLRQQDPRAWRDHEGNPRTVIVLPEQKARFAGGDASAITFIYAGVMGSVAALLAIACVNVATVLLARASVRRKEIAVRLAMGASRRRVVRQLLTECALLAAAGGALGIALAQTFAALFIRFRPDGVPAVDMALDGRILLFGLGASALTVILFGLAPALHTTRPDVNAELKGAARTVRVRGFRFGLRAGLVVIQVAVSLALLAGAGLMLRSAYAGQTADPGFRRDNVLNVGIDLSGIPDRGRAHERFFQDAVRAAAALPGVERVALAGLVPMDGSNRQTMIDVTDGAAPGQTIVDMNDVGPGYFALLDVPMKQGREFTAGDTPTSPPVALVNESLARELWKGQALGKTFVEEESGKRMQVVGVVRDVRHRSFGEEPRPMLFLSTTQRTRERLTLHLRTAAPPRAISASLERMLRDIDRRAAVQRPETMHEYFRRIMMPQRLIASAATSTAAIELMLAVMALYGVIVFAASQRRREIGLRMALGASSRSVIALVMREGLLLTAAGVVIGTCAALAGAAALRSQLIGVGPADPFTFGAAAGAILLVGAAASYIPARRALRVDPSTALRSE